jgi:DNA-binding transcriptional ArsR family regulator
LAQPSPIKLPAVINHLDVLAEAGLITRKKAGRIVIVHPRPQPIREAIEWLRRYEHFWLADLHRLAAHGDARAGCKEVKSDDEPYPGEARPPISWPSFRTFRRTIS